MTLNERPVTRSYRSVIPTLVLSGLIAASAILVWSKVNTSQSLIMLTLAAFAGGTVSAMAIHQMNRMFERRKLGWASVAGLASIVAGIAVTLQFYMSFLYGQSYGIGQWPRVLLEAAGTALPLLIYTLEGHWLTLIALFMLMAILVRLKPATGG